MRRSPESALILGAGPAGLTAAFELARAGTRVTVLEASDGVGGLARTLCFDGRAGAYRFDLGGHRFITHSNDLLGMVERLLGDELLAASRKSVIRFQGRTYAYPLSLGNLLRTAPPTLLLQALRDLALIQFRRKRPAVSFADWVESRFGRALYEHFFAGYTQKLWGIDARELSADWAAQRISLIDLRDVARRLLPGAHSAVRTHATQYRYPKYGFGAIFERLAAEVVEMGAEIRLAARVADLKLSTRRVDGVVCETQNGLEEYTAEQVISTLPLPEMVRLCGGASELRYRALRFLYLPIELEDFSDNTWQYLSDPEIRATRLQEPKRRSRFMAPPGKTSLMLEIPCDEGDATWNLSDAELYQEMLPDLAALGIDERIASGEHFGARARHAYPVMDLAYRERRAQALAYLARFENLTLCGRQGTFRYIFTDTAMEMGQMAAKALLEGRDRRREIFDHRNEMTVIEATSVA